MDNYIVIANSTPLILLQKVKKLELLNTLYSKIYIPEAVYKEVIIDYERDSSDVDFISANSFIEIARVQNFKMKKMFAANLHEGEVETIMLAMEMTADLCILDDLLARKYAKNAGLNITGTLGVLIAAKNKGYINEVKPVLDALTYEGMFLSRELYLSVLSIVKELNE